MKMDDNTPNHHRSLRRLVTVLAILTVFAVGCIIYFYLRSRTFGRTTPEDSIDTEITSTYLRKTSAETSTTTKPTPTPKPTPSPSPAPTTTEHVDLDAQAQEALEKLSSEIADYADISYTIENQKAIFQAYPKNEAAAGLSLLSWMYKSTAYQENWYKVQNRILDASQKLYEEDNLPHILKILSPQDREKAILQVENGSLAYSEMDALLQ